MLRLIAVEGVKMAIEKVSVEEWKAARKAKKMTQADVAKMLYSSLESVKSWDIGRNQIQRGLFNYFLLMTQQHPDGLVYIPFETATDKN
jgi:DNA-binding transcriptional regulator YiaG